MDLSLGIINLKMKHMKSKLALLSLLILSLTSCKTVKSGTAKSIDIVGAGVLYKPVVADLDVNQQKISKTVTLKNVENLDLAKNDVIRDLLNENNADLIIEPKFQSKTTNSTTELTVTGWLAYYKNFRTIEEKDIKLLEVQPTLSNKIQTLVVEKKN